MKAEQLTSIRDEYKQQTRARIVDAAVALTREGGADSVTFANVAARARVSERSVYRHFPTRDALVGAVLESFLQRLDSPPEPSSGEQLFEIPLLMFPQFDDEPELMSTFLYGRSARRGSSNKAYQKVMLQCLRSELPGLDEPALRRRAAIAQLLTSPYAWELMCRTWGFDGIEAGDAAAEALMVLLGHRRADEGWTPDIADDQSY